VTLLVGTVSLLVGGRLLYDAVLNEATNRVRLDLNAAREIYQNRIRGVEVSVNITTLGAGFRSALKRRDIPELLGRLGHLAQHAYLDFAGIVTAQGKTLCRIGPNSIPKDTAQISNPMASFALRLKTAISGTVVLNEDLLSVENPELAHRARIQVLLTPRAADIREKEENSGMAVGAAIPVFDDGEFLGVLYGGVLLNRSQEIVDRVRDTVFQQEIYKGRSIGTATVFFKDIRVSTNVFTPEGKRAIGTRVSKEVREHVLIEGKKWIDRAFVVSDWYITAYEPIEDIFGERVGMLYVGVLEAKYADVRRKALSIFILLTAAGIALAIGLGYFVGSKIMLPVHRLIKASTQVSQGNLSPEIGAISKGEVGVLQKTFREMLTSLQERDRQQKAESEIRLLQSEKQASIGKLAAGVAHEINNPLTGVLTFTHILLRRKDIGEDVRSDLQKIVHATERVRKIVKGLLDFSRQTKLDPEPLDVNRLVRSAMSLVENQALVKGVSLSFEPREGLPMLTLDRGQLESVILNIILNALDAMEPGDSITLSTGISVSASQGHQKGVEIAVTDTGCGIPPENLDKLFDPFFTTKEVGQGTGLGLAVSYGIVERQGGTIRVQSEFGRGSTFTIWLPIDERGRRHEGTGC
jgi:two-component system NtrC family sensor kinase